MKRNRIVVFALLLLSSIAPAQKLNPIHWSVSVEPAAAAPGSRVLGRLRAVMDPGWHLYSLTTPRPPIATTIQVQPNPAVSGFKVYQPQPVRKLDPNFNTETETFEREVTFLVEIELAKDAAAGPVELALQPRFQACDDKQCLPPRRATVTASFSIDPKAGPAAWTIPAGYTEAAPAASRSAAAAPSEPAPAPPAPSSRGLAFFVLVAFGFGLAAVFTPCVFPMIPITVSFFLNKPAGSRGRSVFEAVVFCAGIIVLFTALGLIATAALGPFGVVQLGSSPWVNGFIALVFLLFGLSLLGAFEITIPSSVLTRLGRASQGGGVLGILLMGLTFSLAAFACVGPFVGTLLAASVQQGGVRPAVGMLSFAGGLASPFFFLAVFPSYLKRMPKSGGWMERVKVVIGFLILAAMFKYLSAVDQVLQWNVLTRERFLAAWVVLFSLAGVYLLGFLRMHGAKADETVGLFRVLTGAALLAFAISLVPGMFGARLGELDAYVPPPSGGFFGASAADGGPQWMKNQYRDALARAREQNKPVLVSFTGYACTNCHWMKANMFTRPEISAALQDFVLVELYTDGTDAASEENQKLQETRFRTVAIPYYAILSADEEVIATFPGLTRDAREFLAFLRSGTAAKT